ncbi:hypothetical protein [Desulfosoma sp.]
MRLLDELKRMTFAPSPITLFCLVLSFLCAVAGATPSESDNNTTVVATGDDGFVVTQQDIERLRSFFTKYTPFETNPDDFQRYAVRTFLFAKEAHRHRIHLPDSFQPLDPAHTHVALAEAYLDRVLRDYALDPVVIESYYKAHFEEFLSEGDALKRHDVIPEAALLPLESAKEKIERTLRGFVRQRVASQVFQDLVKRYHVSGDFSHVD